MRALYILLCTGCLLLQGLRTAAQIFTYVDSNKFRIHYRTTGVHAIDLSDLNGNGRPDYVDKIAGYYIKAYDYYINQHGLAKPPFDTGGHYNVYLVDFATQLYPASVLADTRPRDSIADNPNTVATELYAFTGYNILRNTYAGISAIWTEDELLANNVAHEFFHIIQYGYNQKLSGFIKESQAMLMADECNGTHMADELGRIFFRIPDYALNIDAAELPTQHHYSAWIFWKFMQEHADTAIVRHFLDGCLAATTKAGEINALETKLGAAGRTLAGVFRNFSIANRLMLDDQLTYPEYAYTDATVYKADTLRMVRDTFFNYFGQPILYHTASHNGRLMRLSNDYYDLGALDAFSVKVRPAIASADIAPILLRQRVSDNVVEAEDFAARTLSGVKEYWINEEHPNDYQQFVIIVKRFDKLVADTNSVQYDLEIGPPDPWTVYDISPYSHAGYPVALDIDLDPANGNVWVTTGAILEFDGSWHTIRDPFPFGGSWHGWARLNGKDWFGYDNVGFTKYDGAYTDYGPTYDPNITTFTNEVVSDGFFLWKSGDKIVRFNGTTATKYGVGEGLPTDAFSDIAERNGAIWAGSDKGVGWTSTTASWSWFDHTAGLPDDIVWSIDVSPGGVPWVGMAGGKIAKFDGAGSFTELKDSLLPPGCAGLCHIYDIKAVTDDHLWIGTPDFGAHYYDGTVWRMFDELNTGIPEMHRVSKIALEGDSCVWFAMQSKVARFCYKRYLAHLDVPAVAASPQQRGIYPNPATSTLNFSPNRQPVLAAIFDLTGKLVQTAPVTAAGMDIGCLAPGCYLVRVTNRKGDIWYSRFIKL